MDRLRHELKVCKARKAVAEEMVKKANQEIAAKGEEIGDLRKIAEEMQLRLNRLELNDMAATGTRQSNSPGNAAGHLAIESRPATRSRCGIVDERGADISGRCHFPNGRMHDGLYHIAQYK